MEIEFQLFKFNEPDSNGNVIKKDAIKVDDLQRMKMCGEIIDYEIDDNGVRVIKEFDLKPIDNE